MLFAILFDALLAAVCGLSWYSGGWAERMGALVCVVATLLSVTATGPLVLRFRNFDVALVMIDVATLLVFLSIARLSTKFWPIWAVTLQLLTVIATVAHLLHPTSRSLVYAINEQAWAWVILIMIGAASIRHQRTALRFPNSSGRRTIRRRSN